MSEPSLRNALYAIAHAGRCAHAFERFRADLGQSALIDRLSRVVEEALLEARLHGYEAGINKGAEIGRVHASSPQP